MYCEIYLVDVAPGEGSASPTLLSEACWDQWSHYHAMPVGQRAPDSPRHLGNVCREHDIRPRRARRKMFPARTLRCSPDSPIGRFGHVIPAALLRHALLADVPFSALQQLKTCARTSSAPTLSLGALRNASHQVSSICPPQIQEHHSRGHERNGRGRPSVMSSYPAPWSVARQPEP